MFEFVAENDLIISGIIFVVCCIVTVIVMVKTWIESEPKSSK